MDIQKVFDKLPKEQKTMFHEMMNKYNGLPNIFQIQSEINNSESENQKKFYQSALIASLISHMKIEEEKGKEDGKEHHYEVAMLCGGVMEDPDFHYENRQIITAKSEKEAKEKYDKINNCSYYYGEVLRKVD